MEGKQDKKKYFERKPEPVKQDVLAEAPEPVVVPEPPAEPSPEMAAVVSATEQPAGMSHPLPAAEWQAIHGKDPAAVYELRPNAWRPRSLYAGRPVQTATGPLGGFLKDAPACPNCGARVSEIYDRSGATRCLGCGITK